MTSSANPVRGELSLIRGAAMCVVAHAEALLSKPVYEAFLAYTSKVMPLRAAWPEDQEECERLYSIGVDATEALLKVPSATIHDVAIKAHLLAIEVCEGLYVGPTHGINGDSRIIGTASQMLMRDFAAISPLPDMLNALMEYAELCCGGETLMPAAIEAIIEAVAKASTGDAREAERRAFDRPDAEWLDITKQLVALRQRYEGASEATVDDEVDAYFQTMHVAIVEVPAPNGDALAAKMQMAAERHSWPSREWLDAMVADARRLGKFGALA